MVPARSRRLRGFAWAAIPVLLLGATAMVFAKLSGLVIAAAAIAAAVLAPPGPWFSRDRIRRAVMAGLTLGLMGTVFYFAWFSLGNTPVTADKPIAWSILPGSVAYVMAAAWGGALSIGDLAMYLLALRRGRWSIRSRCTRCCCRRRSRPSPSSAGSCATTIRVPALRPVPRVGRRAGDRGVGGSRRDLGTEERHLRIVSLVLFAGIVQAMLASRWPRRLLAATVAVAGVYGVASAAEHAVVNLAHPLGARGFRHLIAEGRCSTISTKSMRRPPPILVRPWSSSPRPKSGSSCVARA